MLKIASFLTALFNLIGMKKGKQVYIRASNFDFSPEICTLSIPGIKHCSRDYPAVPFEWKSCTCQFQAPILAHPKWGFLNYRIKFVSYIQYY